MGKTIHRIGLVVSGDFSNKSIYKFTDDSYIIVSNDENGKIVFSRILPTKFTLLQMISVETVDTYEFIGRGHQRVDSFGGTNMVEIMCSVLDALGGPESYYDVAVYFKNGKKSIIRLFSENTKLEFQRAFYKFK